MNDAAEDLIERLRRGEAAAIGEVYDRHAPAVLGFARRLVGDDPAAEDLVHEVFVTLPSAMRRFESAAALRTYLISIAVNHARHHVRAAARRRAAMDRYAQARDEEQEGSPEDDAMRGDLARALTLALDTLPLDQRAAFVLCEVEEMTARQASEILDAPEATVRTRVFYAKKKLREELARRGIR
jgi:RNA polymerase sigma-70 factor (ECF subfamily)